MEIKTIIVEDEVNARKALENMLNFYSESVKVIGTAATVAEGVALIQKESPDLILLDVNLPDGTGFDLVKKLRNNTAKLVFITAYDEYALKAIKLSALDYLLKPVKPNELTSAIKKVEEALEIEERINLKIDTCIENYKNSNQDKKIIINTTDNLFVIEVKKLIRCESSENYTHIFIDGKDRITVAKTLKEFEEMLTSYGFFRLHQSHLVNLNFVEAYEKKSGGYARLLSGERIPVSSRRKENFLKALEAIV